MIPNPFKNYIANLETTSVPIMPIAEARFYISKEEAKSDLALFSYIMDNAYSGKEYWEKQGIVFSTIYADIADTLNRYDQLSIGHFMEILFSAFKSISDGHLYFSSAQSGRYGFDKTYSAYFSDLLLEKHNSKYVVIKSNQPGIMPGQILDDKNTNTLVFPTLSPTGKLHYLLGKRSWEPLKFIDITISGKVERVLLHKCRQSADSKSGIFSFAIEKCHPIVRSSRFWEEGNESKDEMLLEFQGLGERLKEKEYVIWDIHDNGGGNSKYPATFIGGLNTNTTWPVSCAVLSSPVIEQAKGNRTGLVAERKWELYEADSRDDALSTYRGTLYVLMGEKVASSAEAAVSMAMNVKDCIFLGSNTGGRGVFGDTLAYVLPCSGVRLTIPHKLYLGGANEGEGFTPTYWLDTDDLLGETIRWIENKNNYMAL